MFFEHRAVGLFDVVDLHDVGVLERGGEPSFSEQRLMRRIEAREVALDDDQLLEAAEPARTREEDLAHPTLGE